MKDRINSSENNSFKSLTVSCNKPYIVSEDFFNQREEMNPEDAKRIHEQAKQIEQKIKVISRLR